MINHFCWDVLNPFLFTACYFKNSSVYNKDSLSGNLNSVSKIRPPIVLEDLGLTWMLYRGMGLRLKILFCELAYWCKQYLINCLV